LQIRFPATAILSILHRISGVILFLSLPMLLFLFERSLRSVDSFQMLLELWDLQLIPLLAVVVCWTLVHHLISGVRVLLLDVGVGIAKEHAQRSAIVVTGLSMLALFTVGWALF